MLYQIILSLACLFAFCGTAYGQSHPLPQKNQKPVPAQPAPIAEEDTDSTDLVEMRHADEWEKFEQDGVPISFFKGNVVFFHKASFFYCDSAYLYEEQNALHAWGDVTIIQSDTVEVFSDTLKYFGKTEDAYLIGNVVLTDTSRQIFTERLDYNLNSKIAVYESGGLLQNEESQLTSIYGRYNTGTDLAFFRDSVVVVNEQFTLRADSLEYDTDKSLSTFIGPTLIVQDSAKIYCEAGYYDYPNKLAEFNKNPQYLSGSKIAVSDKMRYEGADKTIFLIGNAKFRDGEKRASAEQMTYHEETEVSRLEGNAYFKDNEREVTSDMIVYDAINDSYETAGKTIAQMPDSYISANDSYYDSKNKIRTLVGQVYIADSTQILEADTVILNEQTDDVIASGEQVVWRDTVEKITIRSKELFFNKNTEYVKASGRPLMETLMDGDTFYLSADTLISEKVPRDSLDTLSQLLAYKDVRLYKKDFQAVSDSMHYNSTDSIFQFFYQPVMWSDSTQFSSDTIRMLLKDKVLDSVFLIRNAMIVDTEDEQYFDQIKGRDIIIQFLDNQPFKMDVWGNGQAIYFTKDDSGGYLGPNRTDCSSMHLQFKEGELETILFLTEPKGSIDPMQEVKTGDTQLQGFKWESKRRPMGPQDLASPFFILPQKSDSKKPKKLME